MVADFMVQRARFPNNIIYAVLVILAACTNSVEPVYVFKKYNRASIQPHIQEGKLVWRNKPFTGILYSLDSLTKDTIEIVCFKEGKEEGEWKQFYPTGKLKEQRFFKDGKKVGKLASWWPNGNKKWEYYFEDGEYQGECKEWNPQGLLVKRMNYNKGYEEGLQQFYYDNGKVKANYFMKAGRRYGLLGTKNCVNVSDSIFKKL
jgi:antitoxin component YwqK of YwqJK toxin-antitoxin module